LHGDGQRLLAVFVLVVFLLAYLVVYLGGFSNTFRIRQIGRVHLKNGATRLFILTSLLVVVLASAFAGVVYGQTETGTITGTVTDSTGAVIPGANITVKNLDTGAERLTTSDSQGLYVASNLLPGTYLVSGTAANLAKMDIRVEVTVGTRTEINLKLAVGLTSTVIEVVGAGGTEVNTESSEISTTVTAGTMTELPTLDRNPYALAVIAPTVSEDDPSGRGVGVSINGLRSAGTNVLLDGAANNDEFDATVGQQVPMDSLSELTIISNNFGPEYGRVSAGVVNVATKSGGNDYHGTVYEVGRWSSLSANTFYNNAFDIPKGIYTRNQFGGSFGGPVKKDKMFFFVNPEFVRVRSAAPTQGVLADQNLISALAGNSQQFFTTYGKLRPGLTTLYTETMQQAGFCSMQAGEPCTNLLPASTPAFDVVSWNVPGNAGGGAPENTYDIVGRFDWNLTDKTTFYSRYAIYNEIDQAGTINTSPYVGYDTGQNTRDQNILLSLVHQLSPTWTEQSKFVFNRLLTYQPLGQAPVSPTLYLQTNVAAADANGNSLYFPGYSATSPGTAIPFGGPQNFYQAYEDVTWTHGRHTLRFGGSVNFLLDNRTFGAYEEAIEDLGGADPNAGINNLILGQMTDFNVAIYPQDKYPCPNPLVPTPSCEVNLPVGSPNFSRSNRYNEFALYVGDSWKATSRLTLNAGVRWEYFGVQHNKNPQLDSNLYFGPGSTIQERIADGSVEPAPSSSVGGLWNKQPHNFGPRVGFAYDVFGDGKTALRGGYGISFERNFGNVTYNVLFNPPNYAVLVLNGAAAGPITTNNFGPLGGTSGTAPIPTSELRWVQQNIKTAYAQDMSLSLQHQFTQHLMVATEYSGSIGEHLYGLTNYNMCGAGNVYLGIPIGSEGIGTPNDCSGTGWYRLNQQYSYINGRDSIGNSFYAAGIARVILQNLGKTGLTLQANYTLSKAMDDLSDTFSSSYNSWNLGYTNPYDPKLDWGPSQYDNRHRISVAAVWAVPFAKDTHGWVKQVADGWEISPLLTARTGAPFTIYDCTMASGLPDNPCPRVALNSPAPRNFTQPTNATMLAPDTYSIYNIGALASIANESVVNPVLGVSDFGPWASNMTSRDYFHGPGAWNLDLGVYKNFFLTERFRLQLRGEAFNVCNHANLTDIGYTTTLPYYSSFIGQYGPNPVGFAPGTQRNMQFTLRLIF
jgi:outer membrane receptor protein involved in Fe transport